MRASTHLAAPYPYDGHFDVGGIIYLLVFFGGIVRFFLDPTTFTLLSIILPRHLYPNGITRSSSAWQTGAIRKPMVGGFLIHLPSVHYTRIFVAFLAIMALICIRKISPKPTIALENKAHVFKSIAEG